MKTLTSRVVEKLQIEVIHYCNSNGAVEEAQIKVSENGRTYFEQIKSRECMHNGTKTFVDEFLERFNAAYCADKTSGNAGNIICDGGNVFYFISQRRLKSLNFKQKFFHFLLKHIFLSGKTASIENIKSLCMDTKVECVNGMPVV